MIPVLPKLLVEFEGGDIAQGAEVAGVFAGVWALMQFLFSPVLGALSDKVGRRLVILLSNAGLGIDYILMAVAPSLSWLFWGRVISGITSSSYPTACAYITDITPPEKRGARFGMLGAAFGLGFIVGPALGGFLGEISLRLPFWVAAGLSLLNTAYGYFILPESLQASQRQPTFSWKAAHPFNSMKFLGSYTGLLGFAAISCLYFLAHEALPNVFVLYADFRYGWKADTVGYVLTAVGVSSMIVSVGLIGPAIKHLGERRALLLGLFFGTAGFAVYGWAPTGALFLAGIPLVALWSLTSPAMQSLATQKVGAHEQGQLQGAFNSLRGITGMAGPIIFTQVFAVSIAKGKEAGMPGAAFYLSALLIASALAVAQLVTRKPRPRTS
jgi:DHA1 family tetracycline resistance protein-like MFS transporter